ncbi:TetR/AcrR family transcriptional regulator [Ktedonosporobacter rubrisoli]|nr:TetR/AcrR family transcriptional regulator [Ktedonosporobacter rubrisoli]
MSSQEKRGIQRERNAARTQEALLDTAEEVFAQSGFEGARLDVIAKRSGYNIALLYRYFENKEGIYRAVIERLRAQESVSLGQAIEPFITNEAAAHDPEQVRTFLETCCTWYFYLASRHPSLLRLLDWQIGTNMSQFPNIPATGEEVQWGEAAVGFLQKAQAAGHLRANLDVRQIIANMFLLSAAHMSVLPPAAEMEEIARKKTLEDLCQKVVEMTLYGVFPAPEQRS